MQETFCKSKAAGVMRAKVDAGEGGGGQGLQGVECNVIKIS